MGGSGPGKSPESSPAMPGPALSAMLPRLERRTRNCLQTARDMCESVHALTDDLDDMLEGGMLSGATGDLFQTNRQAAAMQLTMLRELERCVQDCVLGQQPLPFALRPWGEN